MRGSRQSWVGLVAWLALGAGLVAQAQKPVDPDDPASVPRVKLEEFRKLQASNTVLVVDVRDAASYQDGHIPGAVNVPYADVDRRATDLGRQAGRRSIVLYCSCPSEHASVEAALLLYRHGLTQVSALVGGYPAWVKAGGDIERGQ
jgi:rhodanese-related sulfurtransferase